jgi:hypothetical protein
VQDVEWAAGSVWTGGENLAPLRYSIPDRPVSIPTEISRPHSHYITLQSLWLDKGCINPGKQIAEATAFCLTSLNICGISKWNLMYIIIPARRNFRWFKGFLDKVYHPGLTTHTGKYKNLCVLKRFCKTVLLMRYLYIDIHICNEDGQSLNSRQS